MSEKQIVSELEFLKFKQNIIKFKKDAKNHIKYLTILLSIFMVYFIHTNFFNDIQFLTVSFLTIFQLAFTKNMLANVPSQ